MKCSVHFLFLCKFFSVLCTVVIVSDQNKIKPHITKQEKHSKIIQTMMEYCHGVCVFDQAHNTPKLSWADRGKDRLQKGVAVNSNTLVLGTWKINKMRLVRMAEKGSKTILQRDFTESIKNIEDNKAHRKHRHSEGDGYTLRRGKWRAGTLVNALRVAKIRSNLHTGQYASGVPSDHGQRQALVEPLSLPGVAWNVNEFLCKTAQYR